MSQDDEVTLSQMFPPGQKQRDDHHEVQTPRNGDNNPCNDSEMLTYIMTVAKDCQDTVKTLTCIKTHVSFEQNLKNLAGIKKEEAKKCLAFL